MNEDKPLTPFQIKALKVVRAHPKIIPSEFARIMWPDSPSWRRQGKCGPNGSAVGVGIRQSAGAKLSLLRRAGLIRVYVGFDSSQWNTEYLISEEGKRRLKEALDG